MSLVFRGNVIEPMTNIVHSNKYPAWCIILEMIRSNMTLALRDLVIHQRLLIALRQSLIEPDFVIMMAEITVQSFRSLNF